MQALGALMVLGATGAEVFWLERSKALQSEQELLTVRLELARLQLLQQRTVALLDGGTTIGIDMRPRALREIDGRIGQLDANILQNLGLSTDISATADRIRSGAFLVFAVGSVLSVLAFVIDQLEANR